MMPLSRPSTAIGIQIEFANAWAYRLLLHSENQTEWPLRYDCKEITMATAPVEQSDVDLLTQLNNDYVASVQKGDARRLEQILADDFQCTNPDLARPGLALVDKKRFLQLTVLPVKFTELEADDVQIRVLGDFAIIHGHLSWRSAYGHEHEGRYTDDYARRNGKWVCVSAHVTMKT
jgi:ketosteroid isomerase-like protein